jgi:hypothetical protein
MPEICRFYGILVRMYFADHPPAHLHVLYAGREALVRLDDLTVVRGDLSPRALALTREWAVADRELLLHNWQRVQAGMAPVSVPPLE